MLKQINIAGLEINYNDVSPDKNETIVFIHGNSHSSRTFEHQFKSQELSDYRIIALDLPGHGLSSKSEIYTIPFFSEILANFIEELQIKKYILIGHSLGGHIAIESLDKTTPKGIAIFGTPPVKEKFEPQLCFQPKEELGLIFKPNLNEEEALAVAKSFYNSSLDLRIDLEDILLVDQEFKTKLVESCGSNVLKNELKLLQEFNGAISILHGIHDNYLIKDYLTGLELPLWNDGLIEVPAGHNIHKEAPDQFNTELNSFAKASFNN
jgi:pimeloyl-ACP methyl ester carboxylesterase